MKFSYKSGTTAAIFFQKDGTIEIKLSEDREDWFMAYLLKMKVKLLISGLKWKYKLIKMIYTAIFNDPYVVSLLDSLLRLKGHKFSCSKS